MVGCPNISQDLQNKDGQNVESCEDALSTVGQMLSDRARVDGAVGERLPNVLVASLRKARGDSHDQASFPCILLKCETHNSVFPLQIL